MTVAIVTQIKYQWQLVPKIIYPWYPQAHGHNRCSISPRSIPRYRYLYLAHGKSCENLTPLFIDIIESLKTSTQTGVSSKGIKSSVIKHAFRYMSCLYTSRAQGTIGVKDKNAILLLY